MADLSDNLDPPNLVGEILSDRYRLLEIVGEGGVAVVYRGEHTLMEKPIAVKVLKPQAVENPEIVDRFRIEAQAVARVDHPNVCAAFDFGPLGERSFFLVMEYLDGRNLLQALNESGPMDPARVVELGLQICRGLQAAHDHGIVHRDLKSANIQLVEAPRGGERVKILDFGFARYELGARLTQNGMVMGTPTYMAPELVQGYEADPRTDLYSLGVILCELLTFRPPFTAEMPLEVLGKHVHDPAPSVWDLAPDVPTPHDLGRIVDRLLSKSPSNRYSSASEVADALAAADLTPHDPSRDAPVASKPVAPDTRRPTRSSDLPQRLLARFRALSPPAMAAVAAAVVVALALPVALGSVVVAKALLEEDAAEEERGLVFDEDESIVAPLTLADERLEFLRASGLADSLRDRTAQQRVDALESRAEEFAGNPHYHYVRGEALWAAGDRDEAISSFARAFEIDGRYGGDQLLLDRVAEALGAAQRETGAAEALMKALLQYEAAVPAAMAATFRVAIDGHWNGRKRARALLQETGRWEQLEAWQQTAVELRLTGRDCERVRTLVRRLQKQGEPGALVVLRKTARRPTTGCGLFDKADCYACMREDVARAIRALEQP